MRCALCTTRVALSQHRARGVACEQATARTRTGAGEPQQLVDLPAIRGYAQLAEGLVGDAQRDHHPAVRSVRAGGVPPVVDERT